MRNRSFSVRWRCVRLQLCCHRNGMNHSYHLLGHNEWWKTTHENQESVDAIIPTVFVLVKHVQVTIKTHWRLMYLLFSSYYNWKRGPCFLTIRLVLYMYSYFDVIMMVSSFSTCILVLMTMIQLKTSNFDFLEKDTLYFVTMI